MGSIFVHYSIERTSRLEFLQLPTLLTNDEPCPVQLAVTLTSLCPLARLGAGGSVDQGSRV